LQLAPLRHLNEGQREHAYAPVAFAPRPQPMEPKVTSPGPTAEISPNVGSPPLSSPAAARAAPANPFFYRDVMVDHLQYPPSWLEQSYATGQFEVRSPYHDGPSPVAGGFGGHSPPEIGPEDQLRREQEAAMMLSMMGTAGNVGEAHHYHHHHDPHVY